jgi:hypothetical protein
MTYFEDLSPYIYCNLPLSGPRTRNVGWLGSTHAYGKAKPTEDLLDLLWNYCKVSVVQTRGIHECEFCPVGREHRDAERKGERLKLGSSEIRVFGSDGTIYAAPTLIYHYVSAHNYNPPQEFARALSEGPSPPSPDYFERLQEMELDWNKTFVPVLSESSKTD